ncbi:MAG TPA: SRPBCC domain-containing protein [Thermoleophilia bacterium]|nr:SRPBCC domain-containing protein [Thermoleophilia bacterium]
MAVFQTRIATDIGIEATPEEVWSTLIDFERYEEWNPFITAVSGRLRLNNRMHVYVKPPGADGAAFRPRIIQLRPPHSLVWLGHWWVPGLFDGEHRFTLEPLAGGGVHFKQEEFFHGLLVPFRRGLLQQVEEGFRQMDEALRQRVAGGAVTETPKAQVAGASSENPDIARVEGTEWSEREKGFRGFERERPRGSEES